MILQVNRNPSISQRKEFRSSPRSCEITGVGSLLLAAIVLASGPSGYHIVKTINIGSAKGWDYLTIDRLAACT